MDSMVDRVAELEMLIREYEAQAEKYRKELRELRVAEKVRSLKAGAEVLDQIMAAREAVRRTPIDLVGPRKDDDL